MTSRISVEEFLLAREAGHTVIDVRSPLEFEDSHIPGAFNIPLFTDKEREIVGTKYKQVSKDAAMYAGLDFAGRKLTWYLKQLKKISQDNKVLLYCWRGGMRSAAMAWLFEFAGLECSILEGGYKSYRAHLLHEFEKPANLIIIGGLTGSGKSEILEEIEKRGEQIIHLEKIAHHKGSAFGALGQETQPTATQFENNLFEYWKKLDLHKPIFIEDESITIGRVFIPQPLFQQMRSKSLILVELPLDERVNRILKEYANFPDEELRAAFIRISKRLGNDNLQLAMQALDQKDYAEATKISLIYYDKAYRKGNSKRESSSITPILLEKDDPATNAEKIIFLVYNKLSVE